MSVCPPMPLDEARKVFPPIWTIYERPRDFPEHFVVRMWFGLTPHPQVRLCDTLEIARALVERMGGEVLLPRSQNDDPVILESWI